MNSNRSDEQKFLHDIASPLGTAMLIMDMLLSDVQNRSDVAPDKLLQMGQIYGALEKVKKILEDRREAVRGKGDPNART